MRKKKLWMVVVFFPYHHYIQASEHVMLWCFYMPDDLNLLLNFILRGCKKQATNLVLLPQARVFHIYKPVNTGRILTVTCFSVFFL